MSYILSYHAETETRFIGATRNAEKRTNQRFFGVELEIDGLNGDRYNLARRLMTDKKIKKAFNCHNDGSLENGIELVSQPISYHAHLHQIDYRQIIEIANEEGFEQRTKNGGMHIHVSRMSFGNTIEERKRNIGKVIYIYEKFEELFFRFTRRTKEKYDYWSTGFDNISFKNFNQAYEHVWSRDRRSAINMRTDNYNTIEFRIFNSAESEQQVLAAIALIDCLCEYAMSINHEYDVTLEGLFKKLRKRGGELKAELIERGIFI